MTPYPDVLRVVDVVLSVPVEVEAEDGRAPRVVRLHRDQGDQRRRLTGHLTRFRRGYDVMFQKFRHPLTLHKANQKRSDNLIRPTVPATCRRSPTHPLPWRRPDAEMKRLGY